MLFDRKKLLIKHNQRTGEFLCRYNHETIPPRGSDAGESYLGCRTHYKIGNYWLKVENSKEKIRGSRGSPYTQAQNEAWFFREKLEKVDQKYFIPLLDHTKQWKKSSTHWTIWPYIELEEFDLDSPKGYDIELECHHIVERMVKKYNLSDVNGRLNSNWYIVNGKPLIVDVGLADFCRDGVTNDARSGSEQSNHCSCSECR